MTIRTIDCHYTAPGVAAAYLVREGDEAAFVETNTTLAVPRLLAALEEEGLTPEAVRWVIITHVHLDHAGGASALLAACPNATLLAHPRAAPHVIDPSKLVGSARKVYGDETFDSLYGEILPVDESRVRIMEDKETLEWGTRTLTFLYTRGHANHHFVIQDSATNAVFTGDAFGIAYPYLQEASQHRQPFVFPSTSPTDFDASAAVDAVDRILNTHCERVYLTHLGGLQPVREVGNILKVQLAQYGALVDLADAVGGEGDALEAFVAGRVGQMFDRLLAKHGLSDDDAARELVALDRDLNAQGIAFAVKKRRYKRGK